MIASLYQSGSSRQAFCAGPSDWPSCSWFCISMAGLDVGTRNDPEDVRGNVVRAQLEIVARPVPGVARVGEKVVDFEGRRVDAELAQREVDPARLHVARVEIDGDEHHVREVGGRLRVAEDLVVVDRVESE